MSAAFLFRTRMTLGGEREGHRRNWKLGGGDGLLTDAGAALALDKLKPLIVVSPE